MNAAKHTPGPWVINDLYAETEIHGPQNSGAMIAVMRPWGMASDEPNPQHANARLIAAAPELLEALQGVLRVADRATDEFDAARAAIAKATGSAA
jgi:hypothetical protein